MPLYFFNTQKKRTGNTKRMEQEEFNQLCQNYKKTFTYYQTNNTLHTTQAQKHLETLYHEIIDNLTK